MTKTTKEILIEKTAAALLARFCFFHQGKEAYEAADTYDARSRDNMREVMFKWEFDRATNEDSEINKMENWTFHQHEEYEELVFIAEDWHTGEQFYISAYDDGTEKIQWIVSDKNPAP